MSSLPPLDSLLDQFPVLTTPQRHAPNRVYWDPENCNLPSEVDASHVFSVVRERLTQLGYQGPLQVVRAVVACTKNYDPTKEDFPLKRKEVFRKLAHHRNLVDFFDCDDRYNNKQVADSRIIYDINTWLNEEPSPPATNLFLISGDAGFDDILEVVSGAGHNVISVYIPDRAGEILRRKTWAKFTWRFFLQLEQRTCKKNKYWSWKRKDREGDGDGGSSSKKPKRGFGRRMITNLVNLLGCVGA